MTPRQKKRLLRAAVKGNPLYFIQFRAINARMDCAFARAIHEYSIGQKRAAEAIRDHIVSEAVSFVLSPLVKRVLREIGVALHA